MYSTYTKNAKNLPPSVTIPKVFLSAAKSKVTAPKSGFNISGVLKHGWEIPKIGRCLELIFCFAPAVIDMAIWVVSFSDTPMSRIIYLEAPRLYREHHVYKHMDVPANQFRWLPKGYVSAISHDFPKIGFTIWHRHEALSSSCKFDWLRSVYDHVSGSWMVMISGAMFIIRTYLSNYQVSTTWLQTSHLWIGRNENHLLSNVKVGDQVGSLQQVMSCVIQIAKTVPLQGFIT